MSATATAVQFVSKHRGLRLVRRNEIRRYYEGGAFDKIPEVVYEFEAGNLLIEPGMDVLPDGPGGEEQDALAWLRAHEHYGVDGVGGFHEITPMAPDPTPLYAQVAKAAAAGDIDELHELYAAEADSWAREDVLAHIDEVGRTVSEAQGKKKE